MDRDSVAVRALRTICAEYKNNPGYASERDIVVHRLAREALEFLDEPWEARAMRATRQAIELGIAERCRGFSLDLLEAEVAKERARHGCLDGGGE